MVLPPGAPWRCPPARWPPRLPGPRSCCPVAGGMQLGHVPAPGWFTMLRCAPIASSSRFAGCRGPRALAPPTGAPAPQPGLAALLGPRGALPARSRPPARRGSLAVAPPPPAGLRFKARSGCRLVPTDRPAGGNRLVAAAPPPTLRSFAPRWIAAVITRRSSNSRAPARLLLVPGGGGGGSSSECVSVSCCICLRVASRCCSASASADGEDPDPSGNDVGVVTASDISTPKGCARLQETGRGRGQWPPPCRFCTATCSHPLPTL